MLATTVFLSLNNLIGLPSTSSCRAYGIYVEDASIEVVREQQSFVNTTIVEPSPKTRIYLISVYGNKRP